MHVSQNKLFLWKNEKKFLLKLDNVCLYILKLDEKKGIGTQMLKIKSYVKVKSIAEAYELNQKKQHWFLAVWSG